MTAFSAKPGFALPAVLFIAVLGILLGIGRLMTFSNQCRLRMDRQQELEKILAVRSALNLLQNWNQWPQFPTEGGPDGLIALHSDSDRNVKVLLHPAEAIFPNVSNDNHYCVSWSTYYAEKPYTRIQGTRYRYVTSVAGDSPQMEFSTTLGDCVCLMPAHAGPSERCRLSVDMSDTGRWSDDAFGRRYAFNVNALSAQNGGTNDLLRLILRRKRKSEGQSFNGEVRYMERNDEKWRFSEADGSIIYAELSSGGAASGTFTAWAKKGSKQDMLVSYDIPSDSALQNTYGIQLVGRQLTLFQSYAATKFFKQCNFVGSAPIPDPYYDDFTNNVETTFSTNLVMELEVVASPSRDPSGAAQGADNKENALNKFSHFEVYPAFEFSVFIENKNERDKFDTPGEKNLATVVHLDVQSDKYPQCRSITYDTHGTEIKGWRTGERMAWRLLR